MYTLLAQSSIGRRLHQEIMLSAVDVLLVHLSEAEATWRICEPKRLRSIAPNDSTHYFFKDAEPSSEDAGGICNGLP